MELTNSLSGLQSDVSNQRLEQIAQLRSSGIGNHVDLPQLVVCGDQSAGKSSVLEGITGLPFPKQDGLCTRFPTEIILTHDGGLLNADAEIISVEPRSDASRNDLLKYKRKLECFSELKDVVLEAADLMGLRGPSRPEGPAFGRNVLRIKVTGSIGLHLTIVDLPGLIASSNDEQDEADVDTVHELVDSYLRNPRTIILAVIQAGNDISNQGVIRKSRRFDKDGLRTVGVITKPDLINQGTESRIAALSKNQDTTKLKLGYFLLKNPGPMDTLANSSSEERDRSEMEYFEGTPWNELSLDMSRVGVTALRSYLQALLDNHIERELPKVKLELSSLIKTMNAQLAALGEARPTPSHIRMFLSRLAMRFYTLTIAGLHGDYHSADAKFFASGFGERDFVRLRAFVHKVNTQFAEDMRLHGATLKVEVAWAPEDDAPDSEVSDDARESVSNDGAENASPLMSKKVTDAGMDAWIMRVYQYTRGRELPGNYNHVLLMELFHYQSKKWKAFASAHLSNVAAHLLRFVREAIEYLAIEESIRRQMFSRIESTLLGNIKCAEIELERICEDKAGQPITYNHYYTDNVQNSRHDHTRSLIKRALHEVSYEDFNKKMHISNTAVDAEKLLAALQKRVLVNMDKQACSEARAALNAYYKVARKTFVDNIATQVIERHLVRDLANTFTPEMIAGMSEAELLDIGGEEPAVLGKRRDLQQLCDKLHAGLQMLQSGR